jgi:hypothetical protein
VTAAIIAKKATTTAPKKAPLPKKAANALITPLDYALSLLAKLDNPPPPKPAQPVKERPGAKIRAKLLGPRKTRGPAKFLRGKVAFYVGGDSKWASARTKGRMDFVSIT